MAVAIEDAGFEIRDVICWHYGTGMPKSMDVGKVMGLRNADAGRRWKGWGTSLKPGTEFWTLARKPLCESTVATNVQRFGVGGLNIDDSRIYGGDIQGGKYVVKRFKPGGQLAKDGGKWHSGKNDAKLYVGERNAGRFPANVILDEFAAYEMDRQSGLLVSGKPVGKRKAKNNIYGQYKPGQDITGYGDSGGASRFFYIAKADAAERKYNTHPTVKPLDLLHYLIKLVCPIEPGRIVLEPFAGSGTTCIAAHKLGLCFIAYEREEEYVKIAERRFHDELGVFNDVELVWGA
jgi:site-specific DNA-methyltransferase (adenine-specific)